MQGEKFALQYGGKFTLLDGEKVCPSVRGGGGGFTLLDGEKICPSEGGYLPFWTDEVYPSIWEEILPFGMWRKVCPSVWEIYPSRRGESLPFGTETNVPFMYDMLCVMCAINSNISWS